GGARGEGGAPRRAPGTHRLEQGRHLRGRPGPGRRLRLRGAGGDHRVDLPREDHAPPRAAGGMRDVLRWRWVPLVGVTLLAGVFGYFNAGEAVALHLGLFVLYQVPLVALIFVAFLLGMVTMFLVGLRHDLKVRALLRERAAAPPPRP